MSSVSLRFLDHPRRRLEPEAHGKQVLQQHLPSASRARRALRWVLPPLLLLGLASSVGIQSEGTLPDGPAGQVTVRQDGLQVAVTSADRLGIFTPQGQRLVLLSPTERRLTDAVFSAGSVLALDVTGTLVQVDGSQVKQLGARLCGTLRSEQVPRLAAAGETVAVSCPDVLLVGRPGKWKKIRLPALSATNGGTVALNPDASEVAVLRSAAVLRFRLSDQAPLPTITRLPGEDLTFMDDPVSPGSASALTYDRTGKRLAVSWGMSFVKAYNQSVTVYDLASGTGRSLPSYADSTTRLAFSPDGNFLLANGNSTPRVWNLQSWKRLASPQPTNTYIGVNGVAWLGGQLISASGLGTRAFTLQGKRGTSYAMPHPRVSLAAFSDDGQQLALTVGDGRVFLYDLKASKLRWTIQAHEYGVASLRFNRAGTVLASGNANGEVLRFWDARTGAVQGPAVLGVRSISGFTPGDAEVVMGGRVIPTATLFQLQKQVELRDLPGRTYRAVRSEGSRLTPDGKSVCETTFVFRDRGMGFRASSWALGGLERNDFGLTLPEERSLGVVSADCRVLAVAASDVLGKEHTLKPLGVEVYDPATGRKLRAWSVPRRVTSLALSPDGRRVAYLEEGSATLTLGDVETGRRTSWKLPPGVQDLFSLPLIFRADGRALFVGVGTRPGASFTLLNVP